MEQNQETALPVIEAVEPSLPGANDVVQNLESQVGLMSLAGGQSIMPQDPAIVEGDQPHGKMAWNYSDSSLPGYEGILLNGTTEITYSFPKGSLHGVHYDSREFKAYLPLWKELTLGLKEAFKKGQVFKLQYKAGDRTGKIVWGDIPHKTNKTGGPENNGYPDEDYEDRLSAVLGRKGFL